MNVTKEIQKIPGDKRVSTGPLQVGGDWPGIFIRGDETDGIVQLLLFLKREAKYVPAHWAVDEVIELLRSCYVEDRAA